MNVSSSLRRMAALVVCFSILTVAPIATAQEQSEEMKIVLAAEQLLQQQKPDEALAELQKVFEKTDVFAPAYFLAGHAYAAKGQPQEAFDNFVKAAEYQPGWGDALRQASMKAADMGNLEASWDYAIMAHQAGTDMSDAFEGLQTMGPAPDDLDSRLAAYRVFVAPMNLEQFIAAQGSPFGAMIDEDGSATDTDNISNTKATNVGAQIVSETAGDREAVLLRIRQRLNDSRQFGLVGNPNSAQYLLVIEVNDIGDIGENRRNNAKRDLKGHMNLLDAQSGEQAHRMRIEFADIVQVSEVNREVDRLISLLEEWAAEQQR